MGDDGKGAPLHNGGCCCIISHGGGDSCFKGRTQLIVFCFLVFCHLKVNLKNMDKSTSGLSCLIISINKDFLP